MKALLVLAIVLLHQGVAIADDDAPSLSREQVIQILELVLEKKGPGELAGFQPLYNAESKSWTYITAAGGVHAETFVEVRDADGSYRMWGYGSRRVPEFRMSPSLRRKIRAITHPRAARLLK